jgi:hypothetical protein
VVVDFTLLIQGSGISILHAGLLRLHSSRKKKEKRLDLVAGRVNLWLHGKSLP